MNKATISQAPNGPRCSAFMFIGAPEVGAEPLLPGRSARPGREAAGIPDPRLPFGKMPAKSEKQRRFMRAVAHSPEFARKVGVPQSVGQEFEGAPTAKKGGNRKKSGKRAKKRVPSRDGLAKFARGLRFTR